jgi:ubiquinone/menaquinone biosynthesis C-methylase UbiE
MTLLSKIQRKIGLFKEEFFWRGWLMTGGVRSAVTLKSLLDPERPFTPMLRRCVDDLGKEKIRVLDVGSGPITHIGRNHPFLAVEVVATDFLADRYNRLLQSHKISAPVKTIFADAERLTDVFAENSFDLVVANNSLDHCASPIHAIREMIKVASPGSHVFLRHRENEAVRSRYRGLHQWNFSQENGHPYLWSRSERVDLDDKQLLHHVSIELIPELEHIVVMMKKH